MSLQLEVDSVDTIHRIVELLNKDLRFALFFLSPAAKVGLFDVCREARRFGLTALEAQELQQEFSRAGLWIPNEDGSIQVRKDSLLLDQLSVRDFLNISVQIFSEMSEKGPCWYETLCLVTTDELKKEFLSGVHRLMEEFKAKSLEARGTTILAWTHGSLDCLKAFPPVENKIDV